MCDWSREAVCSVRLPVHCGRRSGIGSSKGDSGMRSRLALLLVLLTTAIAAALLLGSAQGERAQAATPASGTITPTGPSVAWDGPPTGGASAGENTCVGGVNCDTFLLTVAAADWTGKVVDVRISWTI